jgi:hypothetical protein
MCRFFYIQGQVFLHIISRKKQHRIVSAVPDRNKKHILKHIDNAFKLYHSRGFRVCDVHADCEFECIRQQILPCKLNVVAADAHVGEVEWSIRTIKERNRTTVHGLPYKRLPKLMVREVVKHSDICFQPMMESQIHEVLTR